MKKTISVFLAAVLLFSLTALSGCGKTANGEKFDSLGDTYTNARDFSEGLAAVKKDGLWGYIDTDGKYAVEPKYYGAWSFSEGLAAVQDKNGKWGFIDKSGNEVVAAAYDGAWYFSKGLAVVVSGNRYGYINT